MLMKLVTLIQLHLLMKLLLMKHLLLMGLPLLIIKLVVDTVILCTTETDLILMKELPETSEQLFLD